MNCIDPYIFVRSLKIQKKILQFKKLVGLATKAEIDKLTKEINVMEEHIRKLSSMGVHW